MAFKRQPPGHSNSLLRASIAALDELESATAVDIAGAVPYINITQVDPFTAERIGENIMKELLATPQFSNPQGLFFLERPQVSFNNLEVKTEQQYGYAHNITFTMEFTVHRPDVVFSADEYSSWRQLLVEGTAFLLEYGWVANPGAVKNDLLNGIGFYDTDSQSVVVARTSSLICIVSYTLSLDANGSIKFVMEGRSMGNLGLRQVSLGDELVNEFLPPEVTVGSPMRGWKQIQNTIDIAGEDAVRKVLQGKLNNLDETKGFTRDRRRFVTLGDALDTFVEPVLKRMCARIGYKSAEFSFGNFNKRAGRTSEGYGSMELSSKSIGDFPIPIKELSDSLAKLQLRGKLLRVESFIDAILNLTRGASKWAVNAFPAALFPLSREITDGDGVGFFYSIIDGHDGSDAFEEPADIASNGYTKKEIFNKLRERAVPVIELGRITSIIKTFDFEINPEPLQRSIYAEGQLRSRKDAIQLTEQPDPRGTAGRSSPKNIIPLTILQGSIGFIGNFIFQMFSYVWIEFYGAYPISGVYNIRERVDRIEAGNFTTTVGFVSAGLDPFNTRARLTRDELRTNEIKRAEDRKPPPKKKPRRNKK